MINQTETWWVKETSSRGEVASVFGRNLSQDGGTQNSQVYLEDSAGKGYWAEVVTVNPYKVDFKIPDTLANGDYQVFVHNGDAGAYGWSKPLTMTINNGLNYTGAVFNVKNYGAKGDGITDDTAAINAARIDADKTPWATVYLPKGTYVVNNFLETGRDQVRWLGDGKDLTSIKVANGSNQKFLFLNDSIPASQITFQNLTLDGNAKNATSMRTTSYMRKISDLQYLNVKINGEGTTPFDWQSSSRVSMNNSEVIGNSNVLGNATKIFIDGTQFYGTGDIGGILMGRGVEMISITNSIAQNLDSSDPSGSKWIHGGFFVEQNPWGISHNQYLGNNQTIDLGVAPNSPKQADGQQILWENARSGTVEHSVFLGAVTSTTLNTVSVNTPSNIVNDTYYISIVEGKGVGQSRQVKSLNQSTYTIYDDWNIQPDESSVIVANKKVSNAVVYGNSLDGLSDYNTRITGTGVMAYFGATNLIVDNNSFNEMNQGVGLFSGADIFNEDNNPINFTQVNNNTFTNLLEGVTIKTSGLKGKSALGNVVSNNKFNNVQSVFSINPKNSSPSNSSLSANMNVFEENSLGSGKVSVTQGEGKIQNTIFLNNTSSKGDLSSGPIDGNFSFGS
jgi:hypothetical protein